MRHSGPVMFHEDIGTSRGLGNETEGIVRSPVGEKTRNVVCVLT